MSAARVYRRSYEKAALRRPVRGVSLIGHGPRRGSDAAKLKRSLRSEPELRPRLHFTTTEDEH